MAIRHVENIRLHWAPVAQLTAVYVNAHLKEGARPVSPEDFMPAAVEGSAAPEKPQDDLDMFNRFLKAAK